MSHFEHASTAEELTGLIKAKPASLVDFDFALNGRVVSTFALGVVRDAKDTDVKVVFFRHEQSLTLPTPVREMLERAFPGARIDYIDQGLKCKERDVPRASIEERFRNPVYPIEVVHSEVEKQVNALKPVKAAGLLGMFDRTKKSPQGKREEQVQTVGDDVKNRK